VKFLFPVFALFLFCKLCIAEEDFRTWTSSDGRPLEAKFVEMVGDSVKITNTQGREYVLPLTKLSKADQGYAIEASYRALFRLPNPFNDRGNGGIIITSVKGKVSVIHAPRYTGSQEVKPVTRDAIVGESISKGSTIITGSNSEADLLFTNGSLAKLGAESKFILSVFWQKSFQPSAKKVNDLMNETSSSRIALKLEIGDLVVDVKKLNKDSSFMVESPLGVAGIRGTQFEMSVDSKSTELAVLEGKVGFKDANQETENVEGGVSDVDALPDDKKNELANAVADSNKVASKYDLSRLANTVDGYASKPNYIVKSALNMEMIWCPPGSFIMGEGADAHPVILSKGFYLGKLEVTQEQYEKVMGNNPGKFKGENLPVEHVSWDNAVAFCKALTQRERFPPGWEFTLPTEAQWEYACRSGTTTKHFWGNNINPKLANYKGSGLKKTRAVGLYRPNAWGFFDMHGNVREWTANWYGSYPSGIANDPVGPASGSDRVTRGGSWGSVGTDLRYAKRFPYTPSGRNSSIGFRVGYQSSK
jgi:formylglycine-generating enzyme required for sulfatase activity